MMDWGFNFSWVLIDCFWMSFDFQFVDFEVDIVDVIIYVVFFLDIELDMGGEVLSVIYCVLSDGFDLYFSDFGNYYIWFVMDYFFDNEGEVVFFCGDVEYDFEGDSWL